VRKLVGSGAAGVGNAPVLCEALRRRAPAIVGGSNDSNVGAAWVYSKK